MTQGTRPHTFAEATGPTAADLFASGLFAACAAPASLFGGLICFLALARVGARRRVRPGLAETAVLAQRMSLAVVATALLGAPLTTVAVAGVVAALMSMTGRALAHRIRSNRLRTTGGGERTLLVGNAPDVVRTAQLLTAHPEHGLHPVGTATGDGRLATVLPGGAIADVHALVRELRVQHLLLVSGDAESALSDVIGRRRPLGVRVSVLPPLASVLTSGVEVIDVRGLPIVTLQGRRPTAGVSWGLKRAVDFAFAGAALFLALPVLVVAALAIKLDSPGPVFFKQPRVGRHGRVFRIWKLRSMVVDAEARLDALAALNEASGPYFKMENDPRVTRVGRWLRRTSIDEIPQLINVLKGEMSLVGPRPFLESELAADPDLFEWRMDFLPGITGLWQVAGRSWLPVEEGLRMDLAYLEHWNLRLDLLIIARTAAVALSGNRRESVVSPPATPSLERSRYLSLVDGDDLHPTGAPCDVSVVVVTHESVEDIDACLTSLRAAQKEATFEVIVVDNASHDGTADLVAERHPDVRLIRKTRRSGFSTNCNIGAAAATGKYVLLLNPDTVVRPGTVRSLFDYLDRHADVAAVGPRLVYPDGRPQPSARRFPTMKAAVVRRSPARLLLRNSSTERAHLMLDEHSTERDADWLLGAAILVRADALRELGGLDEGYRLYCEDIDLCFRLHRAGWRVRYFPEAVVVHALAETTRQRFFTVKTWWHLRSMARFVRLHGLRVRRVQPSTEGIGAVVPEPVVDLTLPQGLTQLSVAD